MNSGDVAGSPKRLANQDLEGSLDRARGRLTHWVDEMITKAMERGDFDDLPGKGKPLRLRDSDPYGGPDAEVYKYLKEAGFTPEWVELRRKISAGIAWLREHPRHPERVSRIVEVNVAIDRHNRLIPNAALAFPKVPGSFGLQT